ncbi:hypothetical protein NE475_18490, partial [Ruthenibacterium lactatiformans]|nr:hypothetical protein [Ruthenibacterium lactatiformans]
MERNALRSFEQDFLIEYTHNSTAIEGNTLTLLQTKVVLEDGISVGGKTLREIYEVVNHGKAFAYVQKCISESRPLNENIVKDVHALLMENILDGGIYRSVEVCALPGFVDSKNEEKTERNAGYLVVSHSGGGMLRQGTRKGIRR